MNNMKYEMENNTTQKHKRHTWNEMQSKNMGDTIKTWWKNTNWTKNKHEQHMTHETKTTSEKQWNTWNTNENNNQKHETQKHENPWQPWDTMKTHMKKQMENIRKQKITKKNNYKWNNQLNNTRNNEKQM